MNTTINSLLESFNSLELPEISETTASYGTIASTLLLGAAGIYAVYKRYNPSHTLELKAEIRLHPVPHQTLTIEGRGDLATLPLSLKKQLLEKIQAWQGPKEYKYLPTKSIPLLKNFDRFIVHRGFCPFYSLLDVSSPVVNSPVSSLDPRHHAGAYVWDVDHRSRHYRFRIGVTDKSPGELIDACLDQALDFFHVDRK